jgi:hypothetical protein
MSAPVYARSTVVPRTRGRSAAALKALRKQYGLGEYATKARKSKATGRLLKAAAPGQTGKYINTGGGCPPKRKGGSGNPHPCESQSTHYGY